MFRATTGGFLLVVGLLFVIVGGCVTVAAVGVGAANNERAVLPMICTGAVGVVVLLTGVGLITLSVRALWGRTRHSPPTPAKDGRVGRYLADITERREVDGKPHEVLYKRARRGKSGHPSSLSVRVPAAIPTTLQFNRENWFDRLSKRVGISREHQTGDDPFDATVYVRGPSDGYAELLLADGKRRAAVLALLDAGFTEVSLGGTHAVAIWRGFSPTTDDRDDLTPSAADLLRRLSADPPPAETTDTGHGDGLGARKATLWAVAIGFAATVPLVYFYHPVNFLDLLWRAAVVYAVLMPAFAWAGAFLLRGRNTSHDLWLGLTSLSLLLIGLGSLGTVAGVNAWTDRTPPETHTMTVSEKYVRKATSKRSAQYLVYAPHWDGQSQYKLEVSAAQYQQMTPGKSKVTVTTGGGGLGVPWVRERLIFPETVVVHHNDGS